MYMKCYFFIKYYVDLLSFVNLYLLLYLIMFQFLSF